MLVTYTASEVHDLALTAALAAPAVAAIALDMVLRRPRAATRGGDGAGPAREAPRTTVRQRTAVGSRHT